MNIVTLIGRLTRDVELSYVPNTGTAKADFALAVPRDFKNKDGEKEVDFIPVEFMGKKAENIAKYIEKGSLVAVQGNLRIDRYTDKQGNKRTYTKVWGNSIQFLNNKLDDKSEQNNSFVPSFDTSDFQAVEDDDVPF